MINIFNLAKLAIFWIKGYLPFYLFTYSLLTLVVFTAVFTTHYRLYTVHYIPYPIYFKAQYTMNPIVSIVYKILLILELLRIRTTDGPLRFILSGVHCILRNLHSIYWPPAQESARLMPLFSLTLHRLAEMLPEKDLPVTQQNLSLHPC